MWSALFPLVWLIKKSKALSAVSMRLTKLTGKSKYRVHPKHLIKIEKPWYLDKIRTSDKVLDLGCSNGQRSIKAAKKCKQLIGLDYDKKQLQIARNSINDLGLKNITFKQYNLEKKLPFKNKKFDKALCLDVLEHINNRDQLLKEIKRVLKPNGLTFISIPNIDTSWKRLQQKVGIKNAYADPDHKIEYAEQEVKEIVEKHGFKILDFKPVVYDTPWIGFFDLIGGISLKLYAKIVVWKKEKVKSNLKKSTGFRIVASKM